MKSSFLYSKIKNMCKNSPCEAKKSLFWLNFNLIHREPNEFIVSMIVLPTLFSHRLNPFLTIFAILYTLKTPENLFWCFQRGIKFENLPWIGWTEYFPMHCWHKTELDVRSSKTLRNKKDVAVILKLITVPLTKLRKTVHLFERIAKNFGINLTYFCELLTWFYWLILGSWKQLMYVSKQC